MQDALVFRGILELIKPAAEPVQAVNACAWRAVTFGVMIKNVFWAVGRTIIPKNTFSIVVAFKD